MKIAIGSDHAGFGLKTEMLKSSELSNYAFEDFGTNSKESCDYADYAHKVAEQVSSKNFEYGVLICGSANGVAITANKHKNIRAAICWNTEITKLSRLHNNANIICIPARFVINKFAIKMLQIFFNTAFEGGRHLRRINKI